MSVGCTRALVVQFSSVRVCGMPFTEPQPSLWTLCAEAARHASIKFTATVQSRRLDIIGQFERLITAVESGKRAALEHFDCQARKAWKLLETQTVALEVKARQASVMGVSSGHMDSEIVTPPVPVLNFVGLHVFQSLLETGKAWSVVTNGDLPIVVDRAEVGLLDEIVQFLDQEKRQLSEYAIPRHMSAEPSGEVFQGVKALTFQVPTSVGGLAVSPNGALIAASSLYPTFVALFSFPDWNEMRHIGKFGRGPTQIEVARDICFSFHGGSLLVNDGGKRIQEFTLAGEHLRSLATNTNGLERCFAANASVVVTGEYTTWKISVFDYTTGQFIREFSCRPQQSRNFLLTRIILSLEGSHVFVPDADNQLVHCYELTGELTKTFCLPAENMQLCLMHSGHLMTCGVLWEKQSGKYLGTSVDVYSCDGLPFGTRKQLKTTHEYPRACTFKDMLFLYRGNIIEVFW